ncbi:MAG: ribose-phosphate diphosphokinase [Minisyncoccia bacterium]|jgi:ribose-phosphate pyrophosphokinase
MKKVIVGDQSLKKFAQKLNWDFWLIKERRFPDTELQPLLLKEEKIKIAILILEKKEEETINDYLIKFYLLSRKLKELANKVIGVVPYLPYARQDKVFRVGEPLSSLYIAELLENNLDFLITFNMHEHRKMIDDIFSIPSYNLSLFKYLALHFKDLKPENTIIIGPDKESKKFVNDFKTNFEAESYILHKTRNIKTGRVTFHEKKLPVVNKDIIIVDDIVSTGSTVKLVVGLLTKMQVRSISLAFVHPVLGNQTIKELKKLNLRKIVTTNTINNNYYQVNYLDSLFEFIKENKNLFT